MASAAACSALEGAGAPTIFHWFFFVLRKSAVLPDTGMNHVSQSDKKYCEPCAPICGALSSSFFALAAFQPRMSSSAMTRPGDTAEVPFLLRFLLFFSVGPSAVR